MVKFRPFWLKRKKVTLVLGGGSARGIAHIGVLRVLERERIPIDMIVGTSMGALIGAAYAVGVSVDEMEKRALSFTTNKIIDPTIPRMGLLAGKKLERMVKYLVDDKAFSDCRIPMVVITTDIENGEEVVHQKGNLTKIITASCSWPGIFDPVMVEGRLLTDGGIKNNVPTKTAQELNADYIIAVDVGFCVAKARMENIFQVILQSFQIMGEELNKYQTLSADVAIKVELGNIDQANFERSKEAIEKGAIAADAMIPQIKKDLHLR